MSKIKYDEYDDEMNPLHPCLKCGAAGFSMNWTTGLYQCDSCGEVLEVDEPKKKRDMKVKKFRGLNDEDEVY